MNCLAQCNGVLLVMMVRQSCAKVAQTSRREVEWANRMWLGRRTEERQRGVDRTLQHQLVQCFIDAFLGGGARMTGIGSSP